MNIVFFGVYYLVSGYRLKTWIKVPESWEYLNMILYAFIHTIYVINFMCITGLSRMVFLFVGIASSYHNLKDDFYTFVPHSS